MATPMYISAALALTIVQAQLPSTDQRRQRFEAASTGDREVFLRQATADLDAVRTYVGRSAAAEQATLWPRSVESTGQRVSSNGQIGTNDIGVFMIEPWVSPPAGVLVASIPEAVGVACAIQAAHRALRAAGLDASGHVEEAAARGVTSQSGGGISESVDGSVARDSWWRLDGEARRVMERFRRAGFAAV
jgi:hypothetical protein